MDIYRVLNHLPRGNIALTAIAGMRGTLVGQIKRVVKLLGRKRSIGRCYDDIPLAHLLNERRGRLHNVTQRLLLHKILRKGVLISATLLIRVQNLGCSRVEALNIRLVGHKGHLIYLTQQFGIIAVTHSFSHLLHYPLTHSIDKQVGTALHNHRGLQAVAPIVVVRKAAQRSLNATHNNRHVGIETFENLRIYRSGVVGAETRLTTSRIGIVATQAYVGCIVIYHRIHSSGRDAKEQAWRTQLGEVTQIVTPVGLRHDGYAIPLSLKQTANNGCTECRVVDIGIAREDDYIDVIPP